MDWTWLPYDAPPADYDRQARALLDAFTAGDVEAITWMHRYHPRFRREDVSWLPRQMPSAEVAATSTTLDDARLATARAYDARDWSNLVALAESINTPGWDVARFEAAVEAVVNGHVDELRRRLDEDPSLVRARSTRVVPFDPDMHRCTLLHYSAANGVEHWRQRTPSTALEIARLLLERGADPDALAELYGGQCTTLALLVSSSHPAAAGLQVPLVHVLADHGATLGPVGQGAWTAPLYTALIFGYGEAARALADRGAPVASVAEAAGLGHVDEVGSRAAGTGPDDRHRAVVLAAMHGQVEALRLLLDLGEDPDRYNPPNAHAHSTPLHQAVAAGEIDAVRLLVERGARLDIRDTTYDATPLGWADYMGKADIAAYLRGRD